LGTDFTSRLVEFVEVQTEAENLRIGASNRMFTHSNEMRGFVKRWGEVGPHSPEDSAELKNRIAAAQACVSQAASIAKDLNDARTHRNLNLQTSADSLGHSADQDPTQLLNDLVTSYRRELEVDLPPLLEIANEVDRHLTEIEAFVESRLSNSNGGRASKFFGRGKDS
jgi:hypothetical protein